MTIPVSNVSALVLFLLFAFVVFPLLGGLFLKLAFRLLRPSEAPPFARCWLAYFAAYATASLILTAILWSAGKTSLSYIEFGIILLSALAIHLALVPRILKRELRTTAGPLFLALGIYACLLALVLVPFMLMAQSKATRVVASSDVRAVIRTISEYATDNNERFPARLSDLGTFAEFAPMKKHDYSYLGERLKAENPPSQRILRQGRLYGLPIASDQIPCVWVETSPDEFIVGFLDHSTRIIPRDDLDNLLTALEKTLNLPPGRGRTDPQP